VPGAGGDCPQLNHLITDLICRDGLSAWELKKSRDVGRGKRRRNLRVLREPGVINNRPCGESQPGLFAWSASLYVAMSLGCSTTVGVVRTPPYTAILRALRLMSAFRRCTPRFHKYLRGGTLRLAAVDGATRPEWLSNTPPSASFCFAPICSSVITLIESG